ncbi:hypothetical protein JCM33774_02030 [Actinophytocola sp. KF-1]
MGSRRVLSPGRQVDLGVVGMRRRGGASLGPGLSPVVGGLRSPGLVLSRDRRGTPRAGLVGLLGSDLGPTRLPVDGPHPGSRGPGRSLSDSLRPGSP